VSTALTDRVELEGEFERYRHELTGYCYRMLGSSHEAEDAVQETYIRAVRGLSGFERRAGPRTWLYRIAANICLDMLKGRNRRAMPMDLLPAASGRAELGAPLAGRVWIEPIADRLVMPDDGDPADLAEIRESVRLAFIAVLQHLLPRQRAVLLLRDVIGLKAAEVATILNTSVPAVHSMLRRARATLAAADLDTNGSTQPNSEQRNLLVRYIDAFEHFDVDALVALVHDDVTLSMPPHPLWLRGRDDFGRWLRNTSGHCRHMRLVAISVNGSPSAAVYQPVREGEPPAPFAVHVLEVSGDRIAAVHAFLDPRLFPALRLPQLPAQVTDRS